MADEPLDLDAIRDQEPQWIELLGTDDDAWREVVALSVAQRDWLVAELVSEREKTEQLRAALRDLYDHGLNDFADGERVRRAAKKLLDGSTHE